MTATAKKMTTLQLPIGISDFKELIEKGCYFVDKTQFIDDTVTDKSKVVLFTRPRRFGKTINLSMLYYFLTNRAEEVNPELFNGTAVVRNKELCERYQNQHPVIFISFKGIKEIDFAGALSAIKTLISDVFERHHESLLPVLSVHQKTIYTSLLNKTADTAVLKKSIWYLCQYLHKKSEKAPYLLIDEYDTTITASYVHGYYDEMVDLMRGILGEAFKDNSYLAKGVITGITRVSQESIFSGFNNPEVYSMLREQSGEFFGFTEPEVKSLLYEDGHPEHMGEIKAWYNGYQVGKHTLYNPWSILNCIKQNYKFEPYWLNTSDNALIKELISAERGDIKDSFISLLQGKQLEKAIDETLIFPNIKTNEKSIWSLLHSSGYLNALETRRKGSRKLAMISIPNNEVTFIYEEIIESWFRETISLETYDRFSRALIMGNVEEFSSILNSYLVQSGSYFDFSKKSPEQIFHAFMLGLVVGLRDQYVITSNLESGFGRYDLNLLPKDNTQQGLVLEFKTADSQTQLKERAEEALVQIKDKKYTAQFTQYGVNTVLLLGLAFYGKAVEVVFDRVKV